MNCVSHRLAELDLLHAIAYYEEQAPRLGSEFLRAFEEALVVIRRHPKAARAVRGEIRRLVMPRFPYNIIYHITADATRIQAVAHQKRSHTYWAHRR